MVSANFPEINDDDFLPEVCGYYEWYDGAAHFVRWITPEEVVQMKQVFGFIVVTPGEEPRSVILPPGAKVVLVTSPVEKAVTPSEVRKWRGRIPYPGGGKVATTMGPPDGTFKGLPAEIVDKPSVGPFPSWPATTEEDYQRLLNDELILGLMKALPLDALRDLREKINTVIYDKERGK